MVKDIQTVMPSRKNSFWTALTKVSFYLSKRISIDLISIPGDTDHTDEKLETAEVERRPRAETELDLPTESPSKMTACKPLKKKLAFDRNGCSHQ